MGPAPPVSVLVTAYNHEKFIAQALDSILGQSVDFDYEIILGEDCSTDTTRLIVQDYQRRYPSRIRLVLPERNLGGNGNALSALIFPLARGKYIAQLDGDDYWLGRDKLRRQVEYLARYPKLSMCFHQALILRPDLSSPSATSCFRTFCQRVRSSFAVASSDHYLRRSIRYRVPTGYSIS
jgi:glycosyltransferase involved in cell wall biosynthesis